uniref:ERD n=1 Tax=Hosta ventricosa TaxID=39527 RepID=A0A3G6ZE81_9ASPA|nr:ERD [Hosta ventricosa]
MDVISGRFTSTLNPFAAPYVPSEYSAVEDFSDEWWGLVKSSPWFRDYWLRECFEEEEEPDATDLDFLNICGPAIDDTDSLFQSDPSLSSREEMKGMKSKMELAVLGAEKWRGPRGEMVGPRHCEKKAAKIMNVKVSPRMIQQPR